MQPDPDFMSEPDRFGPLADNDPIVGRVCSLCDRPLVVGQRPSLIEIGPADDEDAAKAAAGRPHIVECDIAHQDCAWPF